jgi:phage baseplate assembly protein W
MQGYSPKLPLLRDQGEDGLYGLNKTILETIKQNLKMLLLTSPGERVMDSNFGVGLKTYLFEQNVEETREELENRIYSQVNKYLSFIKIEEITMSSPDANNENLLFINLRYKVPSLDVNDELNLDF